MAAIALDKPVKTEPGIAELCEAWARWAHTWEGPIQGLPMASIVANKFNFQKEKDQVLTHVGAHLTARGKQTRVMTASRISENPEMERIDRAIAKLRTEGPGANLVLVAEHMGYYPVLRDEAFTTSRGRDSYWTRLQEAWGDGKGFTVASLERRPRETSDMWRERIGRKMGVSRTTYYALLREAYQYVNGYIAATIAINRL